MANISARAEGLQYSPIRKLYKYAREVEKRGIRVLYLNIGQPDLSPHPSILEKLKEEKIDVIDYTPSEGLSVLRQLLAGYYSNFCEWISEKDIIVCCGGSEAIYFSFAAITNPGDNLLLFEPFYPNYRSIATMLGVNLKVIPLNFEDNFSIPPVSSLENNIDSQTKGIILCNPSNPTGRVFRENEILKILEIAEKHDLWVICDEAYREYVYEGLPASILSFSKYRERVILIDSFSKRFCLCGTRVGMLVSANKKIIDAVERMAQARLSPPFFGQLLAIYSMQMREEIIKSVVSKFASRRNMALLALSKCGEIKYIPPEGAFYVFLNLPVDDTEKFCHWLLTSFERDGTTLMLAPGPGFYINQERGKTTARLAYVLEENLMSKAIEILSEALSAYQKSQIK